MRDQDRGRTAPGTAPGVAPPPAGDPPGQQVTARSGRGEPGAQRRKLKRLIGGSLLRCGGQGLRQRWRHRGKQVLEVLARPLGGLPLGHLRPRPHCSPHGPGQREVNLLMAEACACAGHLGHGEPLLYRPHAESEATAHRRPVRPGLCRSAARSKQRRQHGRQHCGHDRPAPADHQPSGRLPPLRPRLCCQLRRQPLRRQPHHGVPGLTGTGAA